MIPVNGYVGAFELGLALFHRLEVKNAQLDSVAFHFVVPFLKSYCRESELRGFTLAAWQLFSSQKIDVEEMTFTAYAQGTYTKILEFVDFKERLKMSHAFHLALCETSMSEIKASQTLESIPEILEKACKDVPLEKASTDFFEKCSP